MSRGLSERRTLMRLALNRTEVALAIGVSVGSVDQMVAEGVLPKPRLWHSRKLWLVSEIEAYLNEWPVEGDVGGNAIDRALGTQDSCEQQRSSELGASGYPLVKDPNHPLRKYYDQLGFDPATMDEADMLRLTSASKEKWRASIPGSPLGKRERKALIQLAEHGTGVEVHWTKIKDCGSETQERLKARGFIKTSGSDEFPERILSYSLTEAGMDAFRAL